MQVSYGPLRQSRSRSGANGTPFCPPESGFVVDEKVVSSILRSPLDHRAQPPGAPPIAGAPWICTIAYDGGHRHFLPVATGRRQVLLRSRYGMNPTSDPSQSRPIILSISWGCWTRSPIRFSPPPKIGTRNVSVETSRFRAARTCSILPPLRTRTRSLDPGPPSTRILSSECFRTGQQIGRKCILHVAGVNPFQFLSVAP